MKLKNLFKHFSCAWLILIPSLVAMQPQGGAQSAQPESQAFVAFELLNDTVSNQLFQHAKAIERAVQQQFNAAGLELNAIGKKLHLSLFDAPLGINQLAPLAQVIQDTLKEKVAGNPPSFYGLNFENQVTLMNNIVVLRTTGMGNNLLNTVATQVYRKMGITPQYPYNGHISIARITLAGTKTSTQADKDQIIRILQQNSLLANAVKAVPVPRMPNFKLYTLYINYNYQPLVLATSITEIKEGQLVTKMQTALARQSFAGAHPQQGRESRTQQEAPKSTENKLDQWRNLAQELGSISKAIENRLSGLTSADLREFKQYMIDTGYDQSLPTVYRIVKDRISQ